MNVFSSLFRPSCLYHYALLFSFLPTSLMVGLRSKEPCHSGHIFFVIGQLSNDTHYIVQYPLIYLQAFYYRFSYACISFRVVASWEQIKTARRKEIRNSAFIYLSLKIWPIKIRPVSRYYLQIDRNWNMVSMLFDDNTL